MALGRPFHCGRGVLSRTGLGGPILLKPVAASNMYHLEVAVQQKDPVNSFMPRYRYINLYERGARKSDAGVVLSALLE